jgi:hypothetical protein
MKNLNYAFLFLPLLFLISSCCDNKELGQVNFKQTELDINPYKGNEILSFNDNIGKIITYKGNSRVISTYRSDGCADCCQDYYTIQGSDNTLFSSDYLNSQLSVNLVMNIVDSTLNTNPDITFSWSDSPSQLSILNMSFTRFPIKALKDSAVSWNLYNESLKLREKTFNKVYTAIGEYDGDRLHPDSLYFTTSGGIIGIKFSDGNLFVIQ